MEKGEVFPQDYRVNSAVSEAVAPILFQLGLGGIGGFFIGYAIKKVARVALVLGMGALFLMFLVYLEVINVDFSGLDELVSTFIDTVNPALGSLTPLLTNIPFISGLVMGVVIGFKKK